MTAEQLANIAGRLEVVTAYEMDRVWLALHYCGDVRDLLAALTEREQQIAALREMVGKFRDFVPGRDMGEAMGVLYAVGYGAACKDAAVSFGAIVDAASEAEVIS